MLTLVAGKLGLDGSLEPDDYMGREKLILQLQRRIHVRCVGTVFLRVSCVGSNPVENKKIVDILSSRFMEQQLQEERRAATEPFATAEQEIRKLAQDYQETERRFIRFRQKYPQLAGDGRAALEAELGRCRLALKEVRQLIRETKHRLTFLVGEEAVIEKETVAEVRRGPNPRLVMLDRQILELEMALDRADMEAQAGVREESPEVRKARSEIAQLKRERAAVQQEHAGALAALVRQIDRLESKIEAASGDVFGEPDKAAADEDRKRLSVLKAKRAEVERRVAARVARINGRIRPLETQVDKRYRLLELMKARRDRLARCVVTQKVTTVNPVFEQLQATIFESKVMLASLLSEEKGLAADAAALAEKVKTLLPLQEGFEQLLMARDLCRERLTARRLQLDQAKLKYQLALGRKRVRYELYQRARASFVPVEPKVRK
jgi:hypothetical protein